MTRADLSLAALREMNQAEGQSTDAQHDATAAVRTFRPNVPNPVKIHMFLVDKNGNETPFPADHPRVRTDWTGLEAVLDYACAQLQGICQHKPNVFSLSLLAQALCTAGKLTQRADSKKLPRWVDFWRSEVLAGLLLRAKAESLYEFSHTDRLPNSLTVKLSEAAAVQCAGMLHLQQGEVTWAAVYIYFLNEARAFLDTHKANPVNVFALGQHLAKLFHPRSSQLATSPTPNASPESLGSPQSSPNTRYPHEYFWTHDALAGYLLASLIRLMGREPAYPDMPEKALPNDSSVMVRPGMGRVPSFLAPPSPHPLAGQPKTAKQPKTEMNARSLTTSAADLQANAESAQPHDSHWLLTEASASLRHFAGQIEKYTRQDANAAVAAIERLALQMQEQQPEVLQFLREVANIGSATASFTRLMELPPESPLENISKPASESLSPAGTSS